MHEALHVVKHALVDTLKIAPILLLVYFFIEFLEYKKLMKFEKSKMLKGKSSPVFGALFGSLPQCGFSVITTDLYTKRFVSIGALLAVYIATSDEALPIMLSNKEGILPLLALLISKIILGVIVGYLAMWLYPRVFKSNKDKFELEHKYNDTEEDAHGHIGCCNHDLEANKFDWLHPLLHCLRIILYILIINLVFTAIVEIVGEDKLTKFLSSSGFMQPIVAVLIGLIPNCASSVVLTELYLLGGLSFGAILAGLAVNAGLGLMVLFKQEKKFKEILFILSLLIIPSLIAGYIIHFIML